MFENAGEMVPQILNGLRLQSSLGFLLPSSIEKAIEVESRLDPISP